MEKDHRSQSGLITKSARRFPQGCDPGVYALNGAVGYSMLEKVHNAIMMLLQGLCRFLDRLKAAVGCPKIPFFPVPFRPGETFVAPQVADVLLNSPGTGSLPPVVQCAF